MPGADPGAAGSEGGRPISFAAIALVVVGAAVAVLALTAAAVALLPVSAGARAAVATVGVVLAVVAMAFASRHMTARAVRAAYGEDPAAPDSRVGSPDD